MKTISLFFSVALTLTSFSAFAVNCDLSEVHSRQRVQLQLDPETSQNTVISFSGRLDGIQAAVLVENTPAAGKLNGQIIGLNIDDLSRHVGVASEADSRTLSYSDWDQSKQYVLHCDK